MDQSPRTTISEPTTLAELDEVRALIRGFVSWARQRYAEEITFVERYFDEASLEAELSGLPGKFARPRGRLLIARNHGQAVGCIALRDLGEGVCEMKRLYVDQECQAKGIGKSLVQALIAEAKKAGYSKMRLDTGPKQVEAQALYLGTGFSLIGPYSEMPDELRSWLVFMELDLTRKIT